MPRITSTALTFALALMLPLPSQASGEAPARGFAGSYLAARHASIHSDYRAAATYYGKAIIFDQNNPGLQENAVFAFTGLGKVDAAVVVARQMRELGVGSQMANMVVMADLLKSENYDEVLAGVADTLSVGPLVDGLVVAWSLLGAGQVEEAMVAFDEAGETTGMSSFALYHKALALALAGDFEGAERIFSGEGGATLRLTRRGAFAHTQVLSQLGRNDAALELIEAGWGENLDKGLEALRTRLDAGETVPFTQIRSLQDGLAEVFYTVAGALDGEAADSYTLLYARVAEYLRPDHVDAILLSANLLEAQDQYDLAIESYQRVPADDPGFHISEIGRADAMLSSGREEEAVDVLQTLAQTHGQYPIVHITLGDLLRGDERYDAASEAYDAAVALFDEDLRGQWIVYYARGISHEREKRWEQAETDFRKALELNPGQPQVLNYLGYSFVEMDSNLDEALAMIEEAVAAEPGSGYIIDSLGWVLYRLGRYDEAVVELERAAELMAVDPIVNDHLGDAYWAVGRRVEAEFQWHRALSFDPEPDEATRIRRKLEVGLDLVLEEEGAEPLSVANEEG